MEKLLKFHYYKCVYVCICVCVCAGAAIAAAVLDHLAHSSRCCGLFATHYHQLAAEHAHDPQVAIMHMACAVAEQPAAAAAAPEAAAGAEQQQEQDSQGCDEGVSEVTFLYKLTPGEKGGGEGRGEEGRHEKKERAMGRGMQGVVVVELADGSRTRFVLRERWHGSGG